MPRLLWEKLVEVLCKNPPGWKSSSWNAEHLRANWVYWCRKHLLTGASIAQFPLHSTMALRHSPETPNPSSLCRAKPWEREQVGKEVSVPAASPRHHESDPALAALYQPQGKSNELLRPRCGWRGTCIIAKNNPKADCTFPKQHYSLVFTTLDHDSRGIKERESTDQQAWRLMGKKKPVRIGFLLATSILFWINRDTHNYENLFWLITAIYVDNYQVTYEIILYP